MVDGIKSDIREVKAGIPQGSSFGTPGRSHIFDNERRPEGMLGSENVINQIIAELFIINLLSKVGRRQLFGGNRR